MAIPTTDPNAVTVCIDAQTPDVNVTVVLDSGPADLDFVLFMIQASRWLNRALGVNDLLALWEVRRRGAITADTLAPVLQRDASHAADVLENLDASGLLRADGQVYRLNRYLDVEARRPVKLAPADPKTAVLNHVRTEGSITRREVAALCDLSENQATYLLKTIEFPW